MFAAAATIRGYSGMAAGTSSWDNKPAGCHLFHHAKTATNEPKPALPIEMFHIHRRRRGGAGSMLEIF
jgi:hypothetical protein